MVFFLHNEGLTMRARNAAGQPWNLISIHEMQNVAFFFISIVFFLSGFFFFGLLLLFFFFSNCKGELPNWQRVIYTISIISICVIIRILISIFKKLMSHISTYCDNASSTDRNKTTSIDPKLSLFCIYSLEFSPCILQRVTGVIQKHYTYILFDDFQQCAWKDKKRGRKQKQKTSKTRNIVWWE